MNRSKELQIVSWLVQEGERLSARPRAFRPTGVREVDDFLDDLRTHPHAFVLGCLMDRQVKAERAWRIPYDLAKHLGSFSMKTLRGLSESELRRFLRKPKPRHRFPDAMGKVLHLAIRRIIDEYQGDASRIWSGRPSSAIVVYRFLGFHGSGLKIANMAANILAREHKIDFSDRYSIDISVDVHVRRVFRRMGLVSENASNDEITYRARSLHPKYPGLLDLPCFDLGRTTCKQLHPLCSRCPVKAWCPKSIQKKAD
jgi:endonuclease III